jgi:hypothetical protein
MRAWQFSALAVVAFLAGAAHVVLFASGSGNTAFLVGSGVFFFVGLLSVAIGNTFRTLERRLEEPLKGPEGKGGA